MKWIAAIVLVAPLSAWGPAGHHIVAIIAEQRISTETREKIQKLLGKYSMVEISTCADQIRSNPKGPSTPSDDMCRSLAGDVPSTNGTWHYIDIPVPTKAKTLEAYCKNGNCVTAQIDRFSEILRTSRDDAARRQALLFLVHFVGDIHQPLHAAERGCDHGGNAEHVNFSLAEKRESNVALHHVWDSSELELEMSGHWDSPDLLIKMRYENISDQHVYAGILMAGIRPHDAKVWARATADQMAWESHKLAVTKIYRGIPVQDFCDNKKPPPIITDLTSTYESRGTKVVREQLKKAGVRLAAILENDLGAE